MEIEGRCIIVFGIVFCYHKKVIAILLGKNECGMKQPTIVEKAASIPELLQKYGFHPAPLEKALEEYDRFQLVVPVTGTFHTGKSALLNALLGVPLLPTGITAKTSVPTELAYGDNIVVAVRNGREQYLGLGELRSNVDLTGVTKLTVLYRSPLLQQLKSIRLVDMPGIDSGVAAHEQAMKSYLHSAEACILVFSADEPVVKQSVADYLMQLRLREIDVSVVVTKCDKLTERDLERACSFLQQGIEQTLGVKNPQLICVSARGEVEPFAQLLLSLHRRAGEIAVKKLKSALYEACLPLCDYLSLRFAAERLQKAQWEAGKKNIQKNLQKLDKAFREETQRFRQMALQCEQIVVEKLKRAVNDNAAPLEAMLLEGQNPAPYIDDMLCMVMSAGMSGDFQPLVRGYFKRVGVLLRLYGPSLSQNEAASLRLDELAENSLAATGQTPIQMLLNAYQTTRPLLQDLPALPRSRRRAEVEKKVQQLLPELMEHATPCVVETLKKCVENSIQLAQDTVAHHKSVWSRALEETRQEYPRDQQSEKKVNSLAQDLAAVRSVMFDCEACPSPEEQ